MAEFLSDLLTNIASGQKISANYTGKGGLYAVESTVTVLAAHSDGDIYRAFRVPSNGIPLHIGVANSAVTAGTDYDFGLYLVGGTVLDKDVLIDGLSMATASTGVLRVGPQLSADRGKTFWELAGLATDPGGEFDVCWTANTVGSADGTIFTTLSYNANS